MDRFYLGQLALVGMGGALGSAARFALSGFVHRLMPQSTFPWGTLTVNVLGCLTIGILGGLLELRPASSPSLRMFLWIGVLGGFTTFSTFADETLKLMHGADLVRAGVNLGAQVFLGLAAAWLGYVGAQSL